MSDKLSAFLAEAATKQQRMGYWDCGIWLADWYMVATGNPDPAPEARGAHYLDRDLPYAMRVIARRLGLARTRDPRRGDVGLVSLYKGHAVGAIFTGSLWCMLSDRNGIGGALPKNCRFVAAWHI